MTYTAPVDDIKYALHAIAEIDEAAARDLIGDVDTELVDAVLEEAGRFASERIAPLNRLGDANPATVRDGVVTLPEVWKTVYGEWVAAGWGALAGPEAFGGQHLPAQVAVAATEMWNGASLAFALNPLLTCGAVEALVTHGSDDLKARFLDKLVSGEWTGTMNLTEPQAGSDLSALRTRAKRGKDGSYRIFGQKIYITYGEHELAENICHLVLARLPDAPAGTRGISLFLVPKYLVGEDGAPGARNDVYCHSVEDKLGIHASPTCTMLYGDGKFGDEPGAVGWLIGDENKGLACMFTMMNNARLNVGVQGVAIAERAYQQALAYARERRQGSAPGAPKGEMAPIIAHPDIQRELMTMKALTAAARAICLMTARATDIAQRAGDAGTRRGAQERANLLTPIAKAFSTDIGNQVASMGVQVHGGMGFVEETGAAQHMRDARILPIYEGTNGIQAIDLVLRKLPQSKGGAVAAHIAELRTIRDRVAASNESAFGATAERLGEALDALSEATDWMQEAIRAAPHKALAGAVPYQRLYGLAAGGAYLAKGALAVMRSGNGIGSPAHVTTARYFAEALMPETAGLARTVTGGADALLAAADAVLTA